MDWIKRTSSFVFFILFVVCEKSQKTRVKRNNNERRRTDCGCTATHTSKCRKREIRFFFVFFFFWEEKRGRRWLKLVHHRHRCCKPADTRRVPRAEEPLSSSSGCAAAAAVPYVVAPSTLLMDSFKMLVHTRHTRTRRRRRTHEGRKVSKFQTGRARPTWALVCVEFSAIRFALPQVRLVSQLFFFTWKWRKKRKRKKSFLVFYERGEEKERKVLNARDIDLAGGGGGRREKRFVGSFLSEIGELPIAFRLKAFGALKNSRRSRSRRSFLLLLPPPSTLFCVVVEINWICWSAQCNAQSNQESEEEENRSLRRARDSNRPLVIFHARHVAREEEEEESKEEDEEEVFM